MRIVIPGGTGQLGTILQRELRARGHDVAVLGRRVADPALRWDGRSPGRWWDAIDGADAVVNLTGRSVSCRYRWENLAEMMSSRVESTIAVGQAIAAARRPPAVWLQASTASIYAHTLGAPHDEATGVLGGHEPGVPAYWAYSVAIARAWELALQAAPTPRTRRVALRTGFVMSPDAGGVFDWLVWLAERGLGGPFCGGRQRVSFLTDLDLGRAVAFLLDHESLEGPVNLTAPHPVPNGELMATLRAALGIRFALPILPPMARLGAVMLGTDVELMLKSRRVIPGKLLEAGFGFALPRWDDAAPHLVDRIRARRAAGEAAPAEREAA
ncbi:MAG: DUF1731 domain-containing protein [Myxococcota bacterium]